MPWRVVFFGTADLAVVSLTALAKDPRFEIAAVVTQPDKPRGRDLHLQPSAVKAAALQLGLPVLQPNHARDEQFIDEIRRFAPDLNVVAAYGQILPQTLLDTPRHQSLNVHTSLLPRHRGAAPIQWAILSGDQETGVSIMRMTEELDAGDVLLARPLAIRPDHTGGTLAAELARLGATALGEAIDQLKAGTA